MFDDEMVLMEGCLTQGQIGSLQAHRSNLEAKINVLAGELDELDKQAGELIMVIDRVDALINQMLEENSFRRTAFLGAQSTLSVLGLLKHGASFMSVFSDNINSFVQGAEYNNMNGGLQKARSALISELKEIVDSGQNKISNYRVLCEEVTQIDREILQLRGLPMVSPSRLYTMRELDWRNLTKNGPDIINGLADLYDSLIGFVERTVNPSPRM